MKREILEFVRKNGLSPFNKFKTSVKNEGEDIYKTKDAKLIHNKVLNTFSKEFQFTDTSNLFNIFS